MRRGHVLELFTDVIEENELRQTPLSGVVSACNVAAENTFVVTGNGGLPPDPTGVLHGQTVWEDIRLTEVRPSSVESGNDERSPSTERDSSQPLLVETTGW